MTSIFAPLRHLHPDSGATALEPGGSDSECIDRRTDHRPGL